MNKNQYLPLGLAVLLGLLVLVFAVGMFSPDLQTVNAQKAAEICDNGQDDDGDKLVDCDDPDCSNDPSCKAGTGCSPGYYKNHQEDWVGICCDAASDFTCAEILTDLTCKGRDSTCGRSAAALFLDACTGCTE